MQRKSYAKHGKESILYCSNPNCNNISIKLHIFEKQLISALKVLFKDYKFNYLNEIKNTNSSIITSTNNTIKLLEENYKKEEEKLYKLYNFLEEGTYTKEIFRKRYKLVKQKLDMIYNSIGKYRKQLKNERFNSKIDEQKKFEIENIMDIYYLLQTPNDKNEFLKIFISKVTYLKDKKSVGKLSNPTDFILNIYPRILN